MPDEIRQLFNEKSRDYDAQYADDESNNVFEKEKIRRRDIAVEFISKKLKPDNRILEIGCGTGQFIQMLSGKKNKFFYHGMDLSDSMVRLSAEKFAGKNNIRISRGDFLSEEIEEKYDFIIALGVIGYVADHELFIKKAAGLLNPGGYFIFSFSNKYSIFRIIRNTFVGFSCLVKGKKKVYRSYRPGELKKILLKNNIRIKKSTYITFAPALIQSDLEKKMDDWLFRLLVESRISRIVGMSAIYLSQKEDERDIINHRRP